MSDDFMPMRRSPAPRPGRVDREGPAYERRLAAGRAGGG
jgi:hypothetical protein